MGWSEPPRPPFWREDIRRYAEERVEEEFDAALRGQDPESAARARDAHLNEHLDTLDPADVATFWELYSEEYAAASEQAAARLGESRELPVAQAAESISTPVPEQLEPAAAPRAAEEAVLAEPTSSSAFEALQFPEPPFSREEIRELVEDEREVLAEAVDSGPGVASVLDAIDAAQEQYIATLPEADQEAFHELYLEETSAQNPRLRRREAIERFLLYFFGLLAILSLLFLVYVLTR